MQNQLRFLTLLFATVAAGCGAPGDVSDIIGGAVGESSSALTNDGDCTQIVSNPGGNGVIANPRIVNIYWGSSWQTTGGASLVASLDSFAASLVANPYFMTYLGQYGVNRGSTGPSTVVGTNPPTNTSSNIADAALVTCARLTSPAINLIQTLYGNGTIETPDANHLYVVYLPSGIASQFDACNGFGGHHFFGTDGNGKTIRYAIIENSSLNQMTSLASHEIVEALSDPALNAWLNVGNEIGDICQTNPRPQNNGFQIQQYWSNRYCRCVRPEGLLEGGGVSQVATDNGRIGVIESGLAYVKSNGLDGAWTLESGDVAQLVLDGVRIGVVKTNGDVYVKEGGLDAQWTLESGGCAQLAMSNGRIGVLKTNGDAYVKEGALNAPWTLESQSVTQLVLAGKRIGVLQSNGWAWVKDGALDAQWTLESSSGVKQLALSYDRIGVITGRTNIAWVKQGALDAQWVQESSGVAQLALDRYRIGVVGFSGAAWVKHGALDASWVRLSDTATRIAFPSNGVGYQWWPWYLGNEDMLPGMSSYVAVLDTSAQAWTTDAGF